jgi:hypothetical protein
MAPSEIPKRRLVMPWTALHPGRPGRARWLKGMLLYAGSLWARAAATAVVAVPQLVAVARCARPEALGSNACSRARLVHLTERRSAAALSGSALHSAHRCDAAARGTHRLAVAPSGAVAWSPWSSRHSRCRCCGRCCRRRAVGAGRRKLQRAPSRARPHKSQATPSRARRRKLALMSPRHAPLLRGRRIVAACRRPDAMARRAAPS